MKFRSILFTILLCSCIIVMGQCPSYTTTNTQTGTCSEPAGDITLSDGTFGSITLTVDGDLTINGDFIIVDDLVVNGTLNVTGDMIPASGGSMIIRDGGTIIIGDDIQPVTGITSFFDIIIEDGGTLIVTDDFDATNFSDVTVEDGGSVDIGGDYTSGGGTTTTIDGDFNVDGDFTNESPLGVDSILEGDGDLTVGGTYTSEGDDSGFEGNVNGVPLPVTLVYLTGVIESGKVELEWLTSTEVNNEGFEIQRSVDGVDFEIIGFVGGHGTSEQEHLYKFMDSHPYTGISYYRYRQVDFDGAFEFSPIIMISGEEITQRMEVFPNPTYGSISLVTPISNFQLYDQSGKIVAQGADLTSALAEQHLNKFLTSVNTGTYLLVSEIGGKKQQLRIMKR